MDSQTLIIIIIIVVVILLLFSVFNNNGQTTVIRQPFRSVERFDEEVTNQNVINDDVARQVEQLWKNSFTDASILPVIGYPSNSGGVITLTHTMGDNKLLNINGLPSKSPLANNALYSSELSKGKFLNLYEIMLPDIPGINGGLSTVQVYVDALNKLNLQPSGVHFHWFGATMNGPEKMIAAIHHQNIGMHPLEFSRRTIMALQTAMNAINGNMTEQLDVIVNNIKSGWNGQY